VWEAVDTPRWMRTRATIMSADINPFPHSPFNPCIIPPTPHPTQRSGNGKLDVVESKEVKGAVYSLQPFQGKLLASVNSKVHVFKWVPAGGGGGGSGSGAAELVSETSTPVQVLSLFLAARGDFILVGDLMKSLTLLMYKAAEGSLEVRARDLDSKWLTALAALDDDTYALADNSHNLVSACALLFRGAGCCVVIGLVPFVQPNKCLATRYCVASSRPPSPSSPTTPQTQTGGAAQQL